MTREDFLKTLNDTVTTYINNFYRYDSNPQLAVHPDTLLVELINGSEMLSGVADNDEAIESAAASHGMAWQEASDAQVMRNPDYYAVKPLLKAISSDKSVPDETALEAIVKNYF